jgi:uncharacterized protein YbaP (TraB family)
VDAIPVKIRPQFRVLLAVLLGFGILARGAPAQTPEVPPDTQVVTLPDPGVTGTLSNNHTIWKSASHSNIAPVLRPAASGTPVSSGLMWRATSATNTVYLLGSIHLASPDMYPLPPQIEAAFRNSAVLIVEADMNKVDPLKMQALVLASGFYPPGDSLWNHVSPHTRKLIAGFCADNNLVPEVFARMKPWMAMITISVRAAQKSGMEADLGIDKHFLDRANGMRVEQLESAEWQMQLLASIPDSEQERYLAANIQSPGTEEGRMAEMKAAWVRGDGDRLDTLISAEMRDAAEVGKRLFADRHPHMAEVVERHLKSSEPAFVVVGAGHLVGKDGVIRQLQREGFKVEQVFSSE